MFECLRSNASQSLQPSVLALVVDSREAQLGEMLDHSAGAVERVVDTQLAGSFACGDPTKWPHGRSKRHGSRLCNGTTS